MKTKTLADFQIFISVPSSLSLILRKKTFLTVVIKVNLHIRETSPQSWKISTLVENLYICGKSLHFWNISTVVENLHSRGKSLHS